jgi:fluoroquinolone transport system permease protein
MRERALLIGDIRFQFRYGFCYLYLVFAILYSGLLLALPDGWRERIALVMIFTDPAAMGLYFMGAIVLYEKSERVLNSLAISPVRTWEYVISKLISIAVVSVAVGLIVGAVGGVRSPLRVVAGVLPGSMMFSAVGLMLAANIASLNRFVIATIPAEILINLPAIAWIFGWQPSAMILHPGVCIVEIITGGPQALPAVPILLAWTALAVLGACRAMEKSLRSLGGVKL